MSKSDKKPTFEPEYIRDISVLVYMARLTDESGAGAVDRMIEKDGDGGKKLRGRAAAYDPLTRAYLKALGISPEDGRPSHRGGST